MTKGAATASRGGTVVVLHGLGRGAGSTWPISRYLNRRGFNVVAPTYPSRQLYLDEIVARLHAQVSAIEGPIHFVTHSYGGIVAHKLLTTNPPCEVGRVVMLAPPHGGSEWADLLVRTKLDRLVTRAASSALVTGKPQSSAATYALGIIAGTRPIDPIFPRLMLALPNDGKVSLQSTRLEGAADHLALPVSHTFMIWSSRVLSQVVHFLDHGEFSRRAR